MIRENTQYFVHCIRGDIPNKGNIIPITNEEGVREIIFQFLTNIE